jgi:hypothetical protein
VSVSQGQQVRGPPGLPSSHGPLRGLAGSPWPRGCGSSAAASFLSHNVPLLIRVRSQCVPRPLCVCVRAGLLQPPGALVLGLGGRGPGLRC